jgi:signal peptidase I
MIARSLRRHWRTALLGSLLCGIAVLLACGFDVIQISSISMENSLHDGDFVVIARTRFALGEKWVRWLSPHRGQIIVFRLPNDSSTVMIKRTIGISGDQVRIYHGNLIIDDAKVEEPYVHHQQEYNPRTSFWPMDTEAPGLRPILVPPRHYFVLGDNRERSLDSRAFGPVPENDVLGIMLFAIHWRGGENGSTRNVESSSRLP